MSQPAGLKKLSPQLLKIRKSTKNASNQRAGKTQIIVYKTKLRGGNKKYYCGFKNTAPIFLAQIKTQNLIANLSSEITAPNHLQTEIPKTQDYLGQCISRTSHCARHVKKYMKCQCEHTSWCARHVKK